MKNNQIKSKVNGVMTLNLHKTKSMFGNTVELISFEMGHRRHDLPLSFNAVLAKRAFSFIIVSASGSASVLARVHHDKTLASECRERLGK